MIRPAGRCSVCEAKVGPEDIIPIGKEGKLDHDKRSGEEKRKLIE
jgi:hypothetical protein